MCVRLKHFDRSAIDFNLSFLKRLVVPLVNFDGTFLALPLARISWINVEFKKNQEKCK